MRVSNFASDNSKSAFKTEFRKVVEGTIQKMSKYTLGIDFGTLSARTVLMNCEDGSLAASATKAYPHAVMDKELPGGTPLPASWALEDADDYTLALKETIRKVMEDSGVSKEDVIGLSIDFTSCTVVAADEQKRALSSLERFRNRPHAYTKLWKHHGAQAQADEINELLTRKGLIDEPRYGGAVSPELLLPKVLQVLREDPEIYQAAYVFLEAGDWLTWNLTGELRRSGNMAAYKAMWTPEEGYISKELLLELDQGLGDFVEGKLRGEICPAGGCIGCLTREWADQLGLMAGIAVGASIIDSHAGMPGSGICRKGQMMLVLGTSSVELLLSDQPYASNGVVGAVKGAIMPGYYSLEAGIAAIGDMYGWFADGFVSSAYEKEALSKGQNIHQLLSGKAAALEPGASGLLALDWWNGNKTPYVNGDLSGVLVGLTLQTKPEEIYRALIEATAFGTRMIMEEFMKSHAQVDEVIVSGGIPEKNPLVLRIFTDVLNRPVKVSASDQTAALGSAMYAAAAAGKEAGGYESVADAAQVLARLKDEVYLPDPAHAAVYDRLFDLYRDLVDCFNPGKMRILTGLRTMKR